MPDATSARPVLVYDGDCAFCRRWVSRWRGLTCDAIEYQPYQGAAAKHPQIPIEAFQKSVVLIEPDGGVSTGAHAVFRSLALARRKRHLLFAYDRVPMFARLSESIYRWIARNRDLLDPIDRFFLGDQPRTYFLTRAIFLRVL